MKPGAPLIRGFRMSGKATTG